MRCRLLCGLCIRCESLIGIDVNLSPLLLFLGGFLALVALLSLLTGVRPQYTECLVLMQGFVSIGLLFAYLLLGVVGALLALWRLHTRQSIPVSAPCICAFSVDMVAQAACCVGHLVLIVSFCGHHQSESRVLSRFSARNIRATVRASMSIGRTQARAVNLIT